MLSLILATALMGLTQGDEVERLVARNEAILSGMRTLRATILMKQSIDGGATWRTTQTIRVIRSGRKELVRTNSEGISFRGEWRPRKSEQIDLFEPSGHQTLSVSPPGAAGLDHPPPSGPGGWMNSWKFQLMLAAANSSYRGALDKSKLRAVKRGEDSAELLLDPKEAGTIRSQRWTFSSRRAGLVTKTEMDWTDQDRPGPNKLRTAVREVVDFWDLGPGLVLPKTIRASNTDDPQTIGMIEVGEVVCNEPIGDEEFVLPIPSGTVVVDHRENKYHLWGKDAPDQTFETSDEFNTWRTKQNATAAGRNSKTPYLAAGIITVCVLAILALVVYRRRAARSD